MGGLVLFVSLVGGLLVAIGLSNGPTRSQLDGTLPLLGLLLAPYLLGLHDDRTDSSPRMRIVLLLAFACLAWAVGFRIDTISLPGTDPLALKHLSLPATALWIAGMTVAFDFIDGMDGLAGGLGLMAFAALAAMSGPGPGLWMSAAMAGALAGFLLYNRPAARIVLGNSGSNLLGFALGLATILCCTSPSGSFSVLPAILVAMVPILDASLTLLRRRLLGEGLFRSDLGHLHHRLLRRGFEVRQALFVLLGAAALSGFGASLIAASSRVLAHSPEGSSPLRGGQTLVLSGAGLLLCLLAVAWVLGASAWLRLAPLSELASGPPDQEASGVPAQEAARPG